MDRPQHHPAQALTPIGPVPLLMRQKLLLADLKTIVAVPMRNVGILTLIAGGMHPAAFNIDAFTDTALS